MGGPGDPGSSSCAGRSFPRPWPGPQFTSPRPRLASAGSFSPRQGRRRKRGRASAPSGQWGLSLAAGAWRPRRDASSGGCFKMAGAAGPSLPGSAFWSRDCILCPAARGRRAVRGGESGGARLSWATEAWRASPTRDGPFRSELGVPAPAWRRGVASWEFWLVRNPSSSAVGSTKMAFNGDTSGRAGEGNHWLTRVQMSLCGREGKWGWTHFAGWAESLSLDLELPLVCATGSKSGDFICFLD